MRIAAQLNIPFKTLDLEKEYKEGVVDYLIAEYKKGRTPNPDVFCNKEVKFGAFYNWARNEGADYVATGHYARSILNEKTGTYELHRSPDKSKDQSYFLWTLSQDILAHVLFPVGCLHKTEVRTVAENTGLITAKKKDSQGLCFISNVDMKSFLKHFIETKKGSVLNETGEVIGEHEGALLYTTGERHGFTITEKTPEDTPYYVVNKDITENTITVSQKPEETTQKIRSYTISNLLLRIKAETAIKCEAQIRYHGEFLPVTINLKEKTVTFNDPILASLGQSVVFYKGEMCLGGAIIDAPRQL
jgi:tRNA-specific 2-thiouridylase